MKPKKTNPRTSLRRVRIDGVEKYNGYFHQWIVAGFGEKGNGSSEILGIIEDEGGRIRVEDIYNIRFINNATAMKPEIKEKDNSVKNAKPSQTIKVETAGKIATGLQLSAGAGTPDSAQITLAVLEGIKIPLPIDNSFEPSDFEDAIRFYPSFIKRSINKYSKQEYLTELCNIIDQHKPNGYDSERAFSSFVSSIGLTKMGEIMGTDTKEIKNKLNVAE